MHLTKSSHASKSFNGKNTFMQNALDLRLFAKNSYIDANFADEWNGISLGIQHHYLIDANNRMAAAVFWGCECMYKD